MRNTIPSNLSFKNKREIQAFSDKNRGKLILLDLPYHCRGANIETLKQQRSIWEGDQELVKRSSRDESIWVVTHLCMKAMLVISVYSYSYLN
jgi:hypothetical protein